ncbi:MAG: PQQ-dependent sugar dehydrogenase [Williamsia sp.]|nr:PQQ-dependent sugar dehydrogenase [Williamsia sp.]
MLAGRTCLRVSIFLFLSVFSQTVQGPNGEVFSVRIVKDQLSDPWEIVYGPDNYLWVTEAKGYTVSRINPATGAKAVLLDLTSQRNFSRYDLGNPYGKPWPQGGLQGLALHPQFLSGKPYVYLSYIYNFSGAATNDNGCAVNRGGCFFTTRLVRYEYNASSQTLVDPQVLCDTLPGSSNHNSGRITIAPLTAGGNDHYVYHAIGDMEAGQFDNDGIHAPVTASGTVNVPAAGLYPITITYFEKDGGENMQVYWTGPSIARQPVPAAAFVRPPSASAAAQATASSLQANAATASVEGLPQISKVYPDPFTDKFTLELYNPSAGNNTSISIHDIQGKELYRYRPGAMAARRNTSQVSPGSKILSGGIYFVTLHVNGVGVKTVRLVKAVKPY